jgi:hypothetical protein
VSAPRVVAAVIAICAAATAAILLNLLLLGAASAQNDPVGKLSPRANIPAAPKWTVRPEPPARHGHDEDRSGSDD